MKQAIVFESYKVDNKNIPVDTINKFITKEIIFNKIENETDIFAEIITSDKRINIRMGDYIIKDIRGKVYVCNEENFYKILYSIK